MYCNHRQLAILQQCQREWQHYRSLPDEDKFSLGLFPLRSACLIFRKDKQRSKPSGKSATAESEVEEWRQYRLHLHIAIDPRLLNAEGTQQVRKEKLEELAQTQNDKKPAPKRKSSPRKPVELTPEQQQRKAKDRGIACMRQASTEKRLSNPVLPRPSQQPYRGLPHLQLRVCFDWQERVGIAVFDTQQQQVLQFVSVHNLLFDHSALGHHRHFNSNPKRKGKRSLEQMQLEQYNLLDRVKQQRTENEQRRKQEQKQGRYARSTSESNLGEYLDRLVAARIAQLAYQWQASLIVIPDLGDIRERVEAGSQAWAEQQFPKMSEVQQQTTKKIRQQVHGWSYGRLAGCIRARAARDGLAIATGRQLYQGSLSEKAAALAPAAETAP